MPVVAYLSSYKCTVKQHELNMSLPAVVCDSAGIENC